MHGKFFYVEAVCKPCTAQWKSSTQGTKMVRCSLCWTSALPTQQYLVCTHGRRPVKQDSLHRKTPVHLYIGRMCKPGRNFTVELVKFHRLLCSQMWASTGYGLCPPNQNKACWLDSPQKPMFYFRLQLSLESLN